MAQTKRKRRSKHRGTAAGTIKARGRTGRKLNAEEQKKVDKQDARAKRTARLMQPPSWNRAVIRAAAASGLLFVLTQVGLFPNKLPPAQALAISAVAMVIYVPLGYLFDSWMYKRMKAKAGP